jgi:folate-binding protein YgfZ
VVRFFVRPDIGFLTIGGPDQLAFIQRQSTNDLRLLSAGRSLLTVLTTPAARIIDVLTLFLTASSEPGGVEGSLGVLTLPGHGPATAAYLRSRIFFMDQVSLTDASAEYALIELLGPAAADDLQKAGLALPASDTGLADIDGAPARFIRRAGGWRLLLPAPAVSAAMAFLAAAGAEPLAGASYTVWRVEAGLPEGGFELVDEYTPLETGLAEAVSADKGCYTGQEVLARQLTYDKVTRRLVGLRLLLPAQPGEKVYPLESDAPVGVITSAVESPRFGAIALAVLKRPHHQPGTAVRIGAPPDERTGLVTSLPFH